MHTSREDAESELTDAANIVRAMLNYGVEPAWLWKRNEAALKGVLEELELATTSMIYDQPYGPEEEADV